MMMNKQKEKLKHGKGKGKGSGRFKKALRLIFVEDWGIKVLAVVFAAAVWIISKVR